MLGLAGPRLELRLEVEEDHEAFWSWRDRTGVVHQLKPLWGVAIIDAVPQIIGWHPRCERTQRTTVKKMHTTPITCIACLGWRGSTEAP